MAGNRRHQCACCAGCSLVQAQDQVQRISESALDLLCRDPPLYDSPGASAVQLGQEASPVAPAGSLTPPSGCGMMGRRFSAGPAEDSRETAESPDPSWSALRHIALFPAERYFRPDPRHIVFVVPIR